MSEEYEPISAILPPDMKMAVSAADTNCSWLVTSTRVLSPMAPIRQRFEHLSRHLHQHEHAPLAPPASTRACATRHTGSDVAMRCRTITHSEHAAGHTL